MPLYANVIPGKVQRVKLTYYLSDKCKKDLKDDVMKRKASIHAHQRRSQQRFHALCRDEFNGAPAHGQCTQARFDLDGLPYLEVVHDFLQDNLALAIKRQGTKYRLVEGMTLNLRHLVFTTEEQASIITNDLLTKYRVKWASFIAAYCKTQYRTPEAKQPMLLSSRESRFLWERCVPVLHTGDKKGRLHIHCLLFEVETKSDFDNTRKAGVIRRLACEHLGATNIHWGDYDGRKSKIDFTTVVDGKLQFHLAGHKFLTENARYLRMSGAGRHFRLSTPPKPGTEMAMRRLKAARDTRGFLEVAGSSLRSAIQAAMERNKGACYAFTRTETGWRVAYSLATVGKRDAGLLAVYLDELNSAGDQFDAGSLEFRLVFDRGSRILRAFLHVRGQRRIRNPEWVNDKQGIFRLIYKYRNTPCLSRQAPDVEKIDRVLFNGQYRAECEGTDNA